MRLINSFLWVYMSPNAIWPFMENSYSNNNPYRKGERNFKWTDEDERTKNDTTHHLKGGDDKNSRNQYLVWFLVCIIWRRQWWIYFKKWYETKWRHQLIFYHRPPKLQTARRRRKHPQRWEREGGRGWRESPWVCLRRGGCTRYGQKLLSCPLSLPETAIETPVTSRADAVQW